MSTVWIQIRPDLGPNCLQMLSADDTGRQRFKSYLASSDFYLLLITFANNLDLDQDQQNVGPALDSNCLTC